MKDNDMLNKLQNTAANELMRLLDIMQHLRSPEGCPWDIKQTSQSLRSYLIEETCEVLDAIDADDPDWLCEELGDLLLQIVFHAQIHAEIDLFSMQDVIHGIADKMERRHPHVFEGLHVESEEQLNINWDKIKQAEKSTRPQRQDGLPRELPSLLKAQKVHSLKYSENLDQTSNDTDLPVYLQSALKQLALSNHTELQEQLPTLLFELTRLAEANDIDCEMGLRELLIKQLEKRPS